MPPLYDDFASPLYAPSAGGDGASALTDAHLLLAQHQRKVRTLIDNETGVRFESLALFADPLFALYDLDSAAAFQLHTNPDEADETTVAVMEAARLLWAYFSLPPSKRATRRDDLAEYLIGPGGTQDDEEDFAALLDAVETHWDLLTEEDIELAEDTEEATLGFDALLEHPAFAPPARERGTERTYGTEGMSEMEARALFAQPLLEQESDPDDLEEVMERADDYWTLAQLQGLEREAYLTEIVEANAINPDEAAAIRAEAEQMIARFEQLFADRA